MGLKKFDGTRIFGSGDDRVESEGEYKGETSCYKNNDSEHGILVIISDGTILNIKYGKADMAVWGILVIKKGILFDRIETCTDPDADIYSDIVYLKPGVKFVYCCLEWELME